MGWASSSSSAAAVASPRAAPPGGGNSGGGAAAFAQVIPQPFAYLTMEQRTASFQRIIGSDTAEPLSQRGKVSLLCGADDCRTGRAGVARIHTQLTDPKADRLPTYTSSEGSHDGHHGASARAACEGGGRARLLPQRWRGIVAVSAVPLTSAVHLSDPPPYPYVYSTLLLIACLLQPRPTRCCA